MNKWFAGGQEIDSLIQFTYKDTIEAIVAGKFANWLNDKDGRLATIILCDQFSRNCYRGEAQAFNTDPVALCISKGILSNPE